MHTEGEEIHVEADDVRGGESRGVMRWVLGIGTVIAAAAMTIAWLSGAFSQDAIESETTATGKADALDEGDSTDSVVGVPDDFSDTETLNPADTTRMGEGAPDPESVPEVMTDDN
ncbi:hypothetical protein QQS45_08750 [Alteriqipengyuania flavescens]|uniref:hypothetical protein n=1 Tax=Alteriqipengyuania flavescens TaxID=3053610 RepID=UPI0025B3FF84|nr:hypothetical protein [Alteriqipengyuania flavescens]WJY17732.1 hypothetical protein QQW98_08745 [Alteriqipengyuania flavescens]WJY23675.1 hypothetical protein QQS45_08750 [Alteriqipengyuania flavescens]